MNSGVELPPGVQNFSALSGSRMPPAMSSSSRIVMPSGASNWPGFFTCPERLKMPKPVDFSVPMPVNQSTPSRMMPGTDAIDSTLLTEVGRAYRPATPGNGGLLRGWPRRPSRLSRSAVSSPQM